MENMERALRGLNNHVRRSLDLDGFQRLLSRLDFLELLHFTFHEHVYALNSFHFFWNIYKVLFCKYDKIVVGSVQDS